MLLTRDQMKYLIPDGEDTYRVDIQRCPDTEQRKIKVLDESLLDIEGRHIITNYRDLAA